MSGARTMVLVALLAALTVAPAQDIAPGQPDCEELKKELADLTRRLETMQLQLDALRTQSAPPTARNSQAGQQAGQQEALQLYREVDVLLARGEIEGARNALAEFNERQAGSPTGSWTRSLTRELAVVGKPAPESWAIEKWFQGESEIDLGGQQTTLLIFWESWCPHCRREVPKAQKIYADHRDQGK